MQAPRRVTISLDTLNSTASVLESRSSRTKLLHPAVPKDLQRSQGVLALTSCDSSSPAGINYDEKRKQISAGSTKPEPQQHPGRKQHVPSTTVARHRRPPDKHSTKAVSPPRKSGIIHVPGLAAAAVAVGDHKGAQKAHHKSATTSNGVIAQALQLERKLRTLLDRSITLRTLPSILEASKRFQAVCCNALLSDTKQAMAAGLDQKLWRSACYKIIEQLRDLSSDQDADGEFYQQQLVPFLQDCCSTFQDLLDRCEAHSPLPMSRVIELERGRMSVPSKAKFAAIISHQCYLWLGDLARYTQQAIQERNWTEARQFYLCALRLAPRNGRPCHQLALLATYNRRKMDAVFYFIRSLSVKTPILSAKESLLGIFDDIGKKVSLLENQQEKAALSKKRREEKKEARKKWTTRHPKSAKTREKEAPVDDDSRVTEIWIHPTKSSQSVVSSMSSNSPSSIAVGLESNGLSPIDLPEVHRAISFDSARRLKKHVMLRFLCLHGMLHTKIGMEDFEHMCSTFHKDLSQLIAHYRDDSLMLVKMAVSIVFAIHRIVGSASDPDGFIVQLKEATQVFNVLMKLVLAGCMKHMTAIASCVAPSMFGHGESSEELTAHNASSSAGLAELSALLPTIWVGMASMDVGMFPQAQMPGFPWQQLAALLTEVVKLPLSSLVREYIYAESSSQLIVPPEDDLLNGFLPLQACFDSMPLLQSCNMHTNKDRLHLAMRCRRLLVCAERLAQKAPIDGRSLPCLTMSVDTENHPCFLATSQQQETGASGPVAKDEKRSDDSTCHLDSTAGDPDDGSSCDDSDEDDVVLLDEISCESEEDMLDEVECSRAGNLVEEEDAESAEMTLSIQQLKARRDDLKEQIQAEAEYREAVERIVEETASQVSIVLTVKPRYLVLDTNCFISCRPELQLLVDTGHFVIVVPLVVVNELEGLKKGSDGAGSSDETVSMAARSALEFLEMKFANRDRGFWAMTNQGSRLNTIAFRREAATSMGSNDDIILKCAQELCREERDVSTGTDVTALNRSVVLLTNDRNLRVKAHPCFVPARPMADFISWYTSGI